MDSKILGKGNRSKCTNWTVYKHISPSNKVYIGITSIKPELRWSNGRGYKSNIYFNNAIKKYGWSNFEHIILFSNLSEIEAKTIEIQQISFYKSKGIAYNISAGGDGNSKEVSKETREKISKASKGRKSYERDQFWRQRQSTFMKNNPIFTQEMRAKAHIESSKVRSKPVVQYTLDNTYIKTYNSITYASKECLIDKSYIAKCCKHKYASAKGYIWKYKE